MLFLVDRRHVLRFLLQSPHGYHVEMASQTSFVYGDEDTVMACLTKVLTNRYAYISVFETDGFCVGIDSGLYKIYTSLPFRQVNSISVCYMGEKITPF